MCRMIYTYKKLCAALCRHDRVCMHVQSDSRMGVAVYTHICIAGLCASWNAQVGVCMLECVFSSAREGLRWQECAVVDAQTGMYRQCLALACDGDQQFWEEEVLGEDVVLFGLLLLASVGVLAASSEVQLHQLEGSCAIGRPLNLKIKAVWLVGLPSC